MTRLMAGRRAAPAGTEVEVGRIDVLGLSINCFDFEQTVERLVRAPERGDRLRVHFCALHTLVEASKDPALLDEMNQAGILSPDGSPLLWLARARGYRLRRVSGPDVMLALLDCARAREARHFFYGSTPEVLDELVRALQWRLPGLKIVGTLSPPFRPLSDAEVDEVAEAINTAAPDYVWVSLGSPKQDRWLLQFRPLLDAPALLAVGAAFDFHSGRLRRAPRWAQRAGLEWAFRILSEPRRLTGRYVVAAAGLAWLLVAGRRRR